MKDEFTNIGGPASATDASSLPAAVDRATFQADAAFGPDRPGRDELVPVVYGAGRRLPGAMGE